MRHATLALAALALTCDAAFAQTPIVVDLGGGGDFTALQAALDAAAPDSTILVRGGTHSNVIITKPVRLVANPAANVVSDVWQWGVLPPSVQLDGPGAGSVVLSGFNFSGDAHGAVGHRINPAIVGGGFSEVVILDCDVSAPAWYGLTGTAEGAAGIDVSVGRLWIERSSVVAASGGMDDFYAHWAAPGLPGIQASHVVLLDSYVQGSDGSNLYVYSPHFTQDYPAGGHGIWAGTVIMAGSTVIGGKGGQVIELITQHRTGDVLYSLPDGKSIVGEVTELGDDLAVTGPLVGGGSLNFSFDPALLPGVLVVSLPSLTPWALDFGPFFVDPTLTPIVLPLHSAAFAIPLPPTVGAIGSVLVFQVVGLLPLRASRPVALAVVE